MVVAGRGEGGREDGKSGWEGCGCGVGEEGGWGKGQIEEERGMGRAGQW